MKAKCMVSAALLAFGNNCSNLRTAKPGWLPHDVPASDFGAFGVNSEEICEAERAQLN